ncbi:hypothetical protein LSH36_306g00027 [Paralvinella palmiformis]|uniref:C-type lectin domain-containing protein n=1 Tax=Paralvinella palmiformis TaxID=53620 RepID=A0AAD9JI59_9ANNE|nr:hypothetical protein LSH36_306g00027 [Paralvinella palmiformis]
MRIVDARVLEFPAVTICNANPIKKSALEASAANNPLFQQLMALDGSDRTKKKRHRKRTLLSDTSVPYGDQGLEYYLSTQKETFDSAKSTCFNKGSILAKINNREMANAFLEAFDGFGFMTDLNDIQKKGHFIHNDESEPIWAEWESGEPDNDDNGQQAHCTMFTNLGLRDCPCYRGNMFVCQRSELNVPIHSFINIGSKKFSASTQKQAFDSAESTCFNKGSILAKINNREMANAFLEAFDGFGFMTDLNDIQKKGHFIHNDESEPIWAEWESGEPDNDDNGQQAHCTIFTNLGLRDCPCDRGNMFVCQRSELNVPIHSFINIGSKKFSARSDSGQASDTTRMPQSNGIEGMSTNTWVPYGDQGLEYYLSTQKQAFDSAESTCFNKGSILAKINNREMANAFLEAFDGFGFMTDLNDIQKKGHFIHNDESEPIWAEWESGEPDNDDNGQQAHCNMFTSLGLRDCGCYMGYMFVCQRSESNVPRLQIPPYFAEEDGIIFMISEASDFKTAEIVTKILSSLPDKDKARIGYQVNDLLFHCRHNGRMCNLSTDFVQFTNPYLGNCYTFNSNWQTSTSSRYIAVMSGRRHGLEIGISIGQKDIYTAAGGVAGAVIVVHSKDTMPFPEDYGTVLTPGAYNAIRIHLTLSAYSTDASTTKSCQPFNSGEDIYIASKSTSQWPTQKRMNSITQSIQILYPNLFKGADIKGDVDAKKRIIKQNFLKAVIFYDDLSHEMINEVPQYTGFQFAGDVGGMLGLWIGVSAMGIIQLIEFALTTIFSKAITTLNSKRKVEDISPNTPIT